MDSHQPVRGPALVIWALVAIIFAGLALVDSANLLPLALVLIAYTVMARWIDPKHEDLAHDLTRTPAAHSNLTMPENTPKSRAA